MGSTTQTSTTPDIHHTMGKIGHPPHQTTTTPDIHHTMSKIGHPPHQTSTTSDIHHTRHPPHHNIHFPKMFISQPCARRAHRNCPTYIHPPIVGMIYPIPTYIVRRQILPKLLAAYIQYKSYNPKTYITQLCAQRAQRNLSIYCV